MLCDLPCPSSLPRSQTSTPTSSNPSSTFLASTAWWTSLLTTLLAFQLRTCYQQILLALWTLSPTKMERMIRASTIRLAAIRSRSTTLSTMMPSLSRSTTPLAQLKAATGVATRNEGAHTALTRPSSKMESQATAGLATRANTRSSTYSALRKGAQGGGNQHQGEDDDGVRH